MGLAASQARLLSITSRMADNELRSQLINNAKMRLTADTSKVSDEYVAALNRTQLMFTNFDLEGNELYQALTFSSLTAYSAYNTQYGIVNNNGELIVSVTDANNFKQANGDLEEFLKLYGLEKTTDYWDTMKDSEEFNSIVVDADGRTKDFIKGIGYYDDYDVWQPLDVTVDEMKAIYEAEPYNGIEHYGQKYSLSSPEYSDYLVLESEYISAREQYEAALKSSTRQWLAGDVPLNNLYFRVTSDGTKGTADGKVFEEMYGDAMRKAAGDDTGHDVDYYVERLKDYAELVGLTRGFTINEGASEPSKMMKDHYVDPDKYNGPWLTALQRYASLTSAGAGSEYTVYDYEPYGYRAYATYDEEGNYKGCVQGSPITIGADPDHGGTATTIEGFGTGTGWVGASNGEQAVKYVMDETLEYKPMWVDADGNLKPPHEVTSGDGFSELPADVPELHETTYTVDEKKIAESLKDLYNTFRDNLIAQMSDQEFLKWDTKQDGSGAKDKWEAYVKAATNLANFIYGQGNGDAIVSQMIVPPYSEIDMIGYLNDPRWVLSMNKNLSHDVMISGPTGSYYYDVDWDYMDDGITEDTNIDKLSKSHTNPFVDTYPTTVCPEGGDPATMSVEYIKRVKDPDFDPNNITAAHPSEWMDETYSKEYQANYQVVKDLFLIDCMLEHYGEPNYTWIDQNNKSEDGTAKARWYTNLFNRMQQGYKSLASFDSGLRNSQDWLQFAFESGLVHMEQVDSKDVWNPTLYSNCAKITESSVDIDVTLAEAKYKREMAKIQAKDKQYDIELKNIDTEHESLKQEAETIKEVINNNIKNNMKLFVQG